MYSKIMGCVLALVVGLSFSPVEAASDWSNLYTVGGNPTVNGVSGTKATPEEVQAYVKDSLESGNPLDGSVEVKGKVKNDDGSYSVAITYSGEGGRTNSVITINETGEVIDTEDVSAEELQKLYYQVIYGNEMSASEVTTVNDVLHSATDEYAQKVSDFFGIDLETASSTMAGGVSLAGMVILGAGGSAEDKKALFEKATKSSSSSDTNNSSGPSKEVSDQIDAAFEEADGRVSPYGSLGCADTVCYVGAMYNADLKEEYDAGVAYVPTLREDLEAKGYKCEAYDGNMNKGDIIIYGDDEHVVIADGNGGCFGNSSSRGYAKYYDTVDWWYGEAPTKIIRMS